MGLCDRCVRARLFCPIRNVGEPARCEYFIDRDSKEAQILQAMQKEVGFPIECAWCNKPIREGAPATDDAGCLYHSECLTAVKELK